MTVTKEEICLSALRELCAENFDNDEFCINAIKESAVCIKKEKAGWCVFENEKNSRNDACLFDNIVEAGIDFLKRLCTNKNFEKMKNLFFEAIIGQRIA